MSIFDLLHPRLREALTDFGMTNPTPPQERVIPPILAGENILLIAPTASGKTEAAILPVFDAYLREGDAKGINIIYITPLRALNRDIDKRMMAWAEALGIDVQVRHSDTTQKQRRSQLKKPPQMLITTPETLQAILPTKDMRRHLASVKWVIIDEIHDLAASKRGAQLTVGLARLDEVASKPPQRIGLSATVGNSKTIARFLAGPHPIKIVEVTVDKNYVYDVEYPEAKEEDFDFASDLNTSPIAASRLRAIRDLVRAHRSTLIFVQGRGQAESLGHKLGQLDPGIEVHHGSLSREQRHIVEDKFKAGELKAIVATSTLQLGIDVGNVDLTIQYNSPRQVSTLIQRVGRAGHKLSKLSRGIIVTAYGEDALESMVTARKAKANEIEPTEPHRNPLDVLAHQITGMTLDYGEVSLEKIFSLIVCGASCFKTLSRDDFDEVVGFLDAIKIVNRRGDKLEKTKKGQRYYYENLGMINDERRYPFINVVTDKIIGTVGDEFWTLRARVGLNVILRGKVWKILQIDEDEGRLFVLPSDDPLGALPGWDGELIGVTKDIAEEVGDIRENVAEGIKAKGLDATVEKLSNELHLPPATVAVAAKEVDAQLKGGFPIPTKDLILVEAYERYIIIHTAYGSKVNTTLGCVLDAVLSEKDMILGWWSDAYRILIEATGKVNKYDVDDVLALLKGLTPEDSERHLTEYMEARFPYTYNMKFIAERFGAIPRGKSYGAEALHRLYRRYKNSPIYKEALREAYREKLDLESLKQIAGDASSGKIPVQYVQSREPSSLARHILEAYADLEELLDSSIAVPDQLEYMQKSVHAREVKLSCMNCNEWHTEARIRDLQDRPTCPKCGSGLLAVLRRVEDPEHFRSLLNRMKAGEQLISEETDTITNGRKTADMVLSYGRKAVEALAVHGVGPVTAYQILSRMHATDKDFYSDLLKAKIQYMRTRQYWDNKKEKMR
ncbi:TPA: DEAD/DEAH box helicase [Candidatus Bathyarchaeota archaeon]|nr:DEAD/DEAH box helicase [Candidatus Bathyarchaeota archaeon]